MSKKDAIAAKFALGELTIEDLLPALRKISLISTAKKDGDYWGVPVYYNNWSVRDTFTVTNSDGETEEEQDDNGDFILYKTDDFEDTEGPTFKMKTKVKLKGNTILLTDDHWTEYSLELHREFNLQNLLLPANKT